MNANKKVVDGKTVYPHMYGEKGWYDFSPQPYSAAAFEIAYLSMKPEDLARVPGNPWLAYLQGKNPDYPERSYLARRGPTVCRDTPSCAGSSPGDA